MCVYTYYVPYLLQQEFMSLAGDCIRHTVCMFILYDYFGMSPPVNFKIS